MVLPASIKQSAAHIHLWSIYHTLSLVAGSHSFPQESCPSGSQGVNITATITASPSTIWLRIQSRSVSGWDQCPTFGPDLLCRALSAFVDKSLPLSVPILGMEMKHQRLHQLTHTISLKCWISSNLWLHLLQDQSQRWSPGARSYCQSYQETA